jgi:DNA-binding transcriptional ArsR family regulator
MSGRPLAARELLSAAPVFAALGDEARLRLVARLCEAGPLSISRLTAGASLSRQGVTKHLHALANAGLIRGERCGREHIWSLDPRRLAEVQDYLGRISMQWEAALERLRAFVERQ